MSLLKTSRKKGARRSRIKAGLVPGTMVFIGERKQEKTRIDIIQFSDTALNELSDVTVEQCREFTEALGVTWINVNGIHDIELIGKLGQSFDLHALTLEDIVNTSQRLKTEEFLHYIFIVIKMMEFNDTESTIEIEHVSLILGENYVISFLEDEGDLFDSVRDRIRTAKGRIRSMKSDYLAYALIDTVVDHYFLAVEHIGDRIEYLDDKILEDPKPEDIKKTHRLKRNILSLRRAVWPLREELGILEKSESKLIHSETKVFWRDLYDHTIQIIDMVETFRDILTSMHDTYLSSISNRMNEIMKVLTIISTIFIPLTFIVGVYGMNFENMPELRWHWGYYIIWGVMLVIGGSLALFFRGKKWL